MIDAAQLPTGPAIFQPFHAAPENLLFCQVRPWSCGGWQ